MDQWLSAASAHASVALLGNCGCWESDEALCIFRAYIWIRWCQITPRSVNNFIGNFTITGEHPPLGDLVPACRASRQLHETHMNNIS